MGIPVQMVYGISAVLLVAPWLLSVGAWIRWKRTGHHGSFSAKEAFVSWLLGIIGGGMCCVALFVPLTLDNPDPTPPEGFSSSCESSIYLGLFCGGSVGAAVTPLAYSYFIRKIGIRKAFLPALMGTLLGVLLDFLLLRFDSLLLMAAMPVLLFFGALAWAEQKYSEPLRT